MYSTDNKSLQQSYCCHLQLQYLHVFFMTGLTLSIKKISGRNSTKVDFNPQIIMYECTRGAGAGQFYSEK